jgi:hypothetical protein
MLKLHLAGEQVTEEVINGERIHSGCHRGDKRVIL